jgi:RHS repeat-associated protein
MTRPVALMRRLRCVVLVAAGVLALPGSAEPAPAESQSRFIIVLERLTAGDEPFDVTKFGGKVDRRSGSRVAVTLPESALEGVRRNPRVRYIQRLVTGLPVARNTAEAAPGSTALPPHPRFDAAVNGADSLTLGPYAYDGAGNITEIARGVASTAPRDTFRYDRLQRLQSASVHDGTTARAESYVYDSTGNLISLTTGGVTIPLPVDAATNRLSSTSGFEYDDVGNMTRSPASTYAYDSTGMLSSENMAVFHVYTADDERIAVVRNAWREDERWNWTIRDLSAKPLREYESFGTSDEQDFLWVTDHYYADGRLVAADREAVEGGRRHFHLDHLGTPRLVTNADGDRISAHAYLPFGAEATSILQERARGFEREEPIRFTGHERDGLASTSTETAAYLDYMHARFYNPKWGRFLSVDPGKDWDPKRPQSWNMYTYVQNNPVRFTDPTGKYVCRGAEQDCKAVEVSLQLAREAAMALKSNDPRRAELQKVLTAYGKVGDAKTKIGTVWANPTTTTGAPLLRAGVLAQAGRDGNVFVSLTNVLTKAQGNGEKAFTILGGALMHEGKHELQPAVVGLPIGARPSFLSMVFYERQAYTVERGYYQGLGEDAMAPDPTKGAFASASAGCNTPQGCDP